MTDLILFSVFDNFEGSNKECQQTSVASTDDVVKDESTQNASQASGFIHKSRFARKSGLKPIRPSSFANSGSTPAAVTPAKTPIYSFNYTQNDPSRSIYKAFTPK